MWEAADFSIEDLSPPPDVLRVLQQAYEDAEDFQYNSNEETTTINETFGCSLLDVPLLTFKDIQSQSKFIMPFIFV